jgi:hypothetical protein
MFKVDITRFDPFSIVKYQRSFWADGLTIGKGVLAGCLTATALILKVSRHLLDVKTNLLLPNRVSANKDNLAILGVVYVVVTTAAGFTSHSLEKFEKAELLLRFAKLSNLPPK